MATKGMKFHRHKCPDPECGHVWRHKSETIGGVSFGTCEAHTCPKCRKRKQWDMHLTPKQKKEYGVA